MPCQEEDTQAVGLEHSQRIRRSGQCSEYFGVSDERYFRRVQRFFVDRSRSDRICLAGHGDLDALLDVFKCSLSAHRGNNAEGKFRLINISKVYKVQNAGTVITCGRLLHNINGKRSADNTDGIFHDLTVTDHDNIGCIIYFFQSTGLGYNLGTDACGIADRYCYKWF